MLEKRAELSPMEFKNHYPKAYRWLYENDREWLNKQLTKERKKSCWKERDEEYLKRYQIALDWIKNEGDWKRRITLGYLSSVAAISYTKVVCYKRRLPKSKAFLDTVIESKEVWLERRLRRICEEKQGAISIKDIKDGMGLKPNTYLKYGDIILSIIEKLNDNH